MKLVTVPFKNTMFCFLLVLIASFFQFPAMMQQITESPIFLILNEVNKKQQEMLQMLDSCNCAQRPNQPMPFVPAKDGNYF
jgi:hypothetical protein